MSGALGLLNEYRQCSFRGIPFATIGTAGANGRKVAVHDYPFRDDAVAEDLGRRPRSFRVRGFVTGLLYHAQFDLLQAAIEQPGPGLLVHPSRGVLKAAVLNFDWREPDGRFGVIEFDIEFLEQKNFLSTLVLAAASAVIAVAGAVLQSACSSDYSSRTSAGYAAGDTAPKAALATVQVWGAQAVGLSQRPDVMTSALASLPTYYGRFVSGNSAVTAPGGTVASALDGVVIGQAAVGAATAALSASLDAASLAMAVLAVPQALAALVADPATQVALLSELAAYAPATLASTAPTGASIATAQTAAAALCRRATIASIGIACSAYQPTSYDDAEALRASVCAIMRAEALVAADAGDDASFQAIRALLSQVTQDLSTRASQLSRLITVTRNASVPAPLLAQQLYADGSRAPELIRRANPIHPAFMPVSFPALAS